MLIKMALQCFNCCLIRLIHTLRRVWKQPSAVQCADTAMLFLWNLPVICERLLEQPMCSCVDVHAWSCEWQLHVQSVPHRIHWKSVRQLRMFVMLQSIEFTLHLKKTNFCDFCCSFIAFSILLFSCSGDMFTPTGLQSSQQLIHHRQLVLWVLWKWCVFCVLL